MATITASATGGNWNATTAWTGGVVPTAADDVLLAAGSGSITIPTGITGNCRSLDCTGYTAALAWASTSANLRVGDALGGNCTFSSTMTLTRTGIGNLTLVGSTASTTYQLTTAGKIVPNLIVSSGATTTIQFADNVNATGAQLFLTSGILDTNSQTFTGLLINCSGATARTLTLGSSVLTLTQPNNFWTFTSTGLTMTANTAGVISTGSGATFAGGDVDYNGMSLSLTGLALSVISGVNTFANLTRNGTNTLDAALVLAADQTVAGTLTMAGFSAAARLWVLSSVPGTPHTLTCNGTVVASRVDFEDITAAGSASWNLAGITDGSGDCGGNSGITFTTATTKYAKAPGNWSATATWALSSGGAAGAPYPLPQDNVVMDATAGAGTYTMNLQRHCADLTCTGFTGTLLHSSNSTQRYMYGSLSLSAGMTFTAFGSLTLAGRGTHTIDLAGKAFTGASTRVIVIGRFGGTYTLLSDSDFGSLAAATNSGLSIQGGVSFDANGFNVTTNRVATATATINMGSGIWTLTGTAAEFTWGAAVGTTINAGTSSIVIANTSVSTRTFSGASKTYYDLTYTVAGSAGQLSMVGSNTFHDLNFSDASNARTLRFTTGTVTTFTGNLNAVGTPGNLMTITTITAAQHTLLKTSGIISADYVSVSRSNALGGAVFYAGANSVDGGNNTGWTFTAPPPAGFSGTATLSGDGSLSVGGTPGLAGAPAFTGDGSLTAAGAPTTTAAVALSGDGSLAVTGSPTTLGTPALAGAGTLTVSTAPTLAGAVALSGTGTLAVSGGTSGYAGTAGLTGAGTLAVAGSPTATAAVALTGTGTLAVVGTPTLQIAVAFTGDGTLSALGIFTTTGSVVLSGTGVLTLTGGPAREITITLGPLYGRGGFTVGQPHGHTVTPTGPTGHPLTVTAGRS